MSDDEPAIQRLVLAMLSPERGSAALAALQVRPELLESRATASRAVIATTTRPPERSTCGSTVAARPAFSG